MNGVSHMNGVSQWRAFPSHLVFLLSLSLLLSLSCARSLSNFFRFGAIGLGTACRASKMAPGRAVDERALGNLGVSHSALWWLCVEEIMRTGGERPPVAVHRGPWVGGDRYWLGHHVAHPRNPGDCRT